MQDYSIKGLVYEVQPVQEISMSFKKKTIIVEYNLDGFTQYLPFDFINDNIQYTSEITKGDFVSILFNVRGRKWIQDGTTTKYFPSLEGLMINKQ